jgi:hypothetical protein
MSASFYPINFFLWQEDKCVYQPPVSQTSVSYNWEYQQCHRYLSQQFQTCGKVTILHLNNLELITLWSLMPVAARPNISTLWDTLKHYDCDLESGRRHWRVSMLFHMGLSSTCRGCVMGLSHLITSHLFISRNLFLYFTSIIRSIIVSWYFTVAMLHCRWHKSQESKACLYCLLEMLYKRKFMLFRMFF